METTPRINEILVWFWRFAGDLMTSLQLANSSMFVPRRRETLGRRADNGQSCRRKVQCRRRRWLQALSTGGRLNGVGQVGRSKSTDALVYHDGSLKDMRCGTRSQCRRRSSGVIWSQRLVWETSRAAAFITACKRSRWNDGMPASVAFPKSSFVRTKASTRDWKLLDSYLKLVISVTILIIPFVFQLLYANS